jgi:hypothetical protein
VTIVEIVITLPGANGGPAQLVDQSGQMLTDVKRARDEAGDLVFAFSKTMRQVFAHSDHWAVLSKRCVMAFESRYALRLYELLTLRAGLTHKSSEVFLLDDLRLRLGVPAGTLGRWQDIKRRALEPALAEVNQLSGLLVTFAPIKRGRAVMAVKLTWREKDAQGRKAVARELEASRVGRRARRNGTVETMMAETLSEPPAAAPVTRTAPQPDAAFPADGTIAYGRWGELVRQHAPAPTPDVDRVANAFRDWASHAGLPLGGATVEKAFVTFCQGFRSRR